MRHLWKHSWKTHILYCYLEDGQRVYLIHCKRLEKTIAGINNAGESYVLQGIWDELTDAEIIEMLRITSKYGDPTKMWRVFSENELA